MNMQALYITLALLMTLSLVSASAQLIPQPAQTADVQNQMRWEMSQVENAARLQQNGNENSVLITQVNRQYAEIAQQGNGHLADVVLEGANNKLELKQSGESNTYLLTLDGARNELEVRQDGVENYIMQELRGVTGTEIRVIQEGTGHQLIHREANVDPVGVPITITQRGPSAGRPIEVTTNPSAFPLPQQ